MFFSASSAPLVFIFTYFFERPLWVGCLVEVKQVSLVSVNGLQASSHSPEFEVSV